MDELEFYEQCIKDISESRKLDLLDAAEFLKEALVFEKENIMKLVSIRKQYLSPQDGRLVHSIGSYFPQFKDDELITLTTMVIEISKASCFYHQIKSFEKYHPTQPLFQEHPELLEKLRKKSGGSPDLELIRLDAVKYNPFPNMPKYRTCKYKESYLFLDSYLNAMIPFYLIQKYGTENLYIRLDPYHISKTPPPMILEEEFIQPPNPYWIERLLIHPNQHEGTELFLPKYTIEDIAGDDWKLKQWWEYHTKGIRKLQIVANMKNEGETRHFSMSLEELSEESIEDGMLIGRMIHLDAIDSYDTPFDQVKLNHLDLAVNIYMESSIQERLDSTLAKGKRITDATLRTHLIRADDIMLSDLLEIAQTFFHSKTMVNEWIDTQFQFSKKENE